MATMIDVLRYAAAKEAAWEQSVKEMSGYERITTFYSDYSIADCYGEKAIRDTFNRCKDWINNYKYYTELIIVLNHKIWEHYDAGRQELAKVYDSLWRRAVDNFIVKYEGNKEEMTYYYQMTD